MLFAVDKGDGLCAAVRGAQYPATVPLVTAQLPFFLVTAALPGPLQGARLNRQAVTITVASQPWIAYPINTRTAKG